MHLPGNPFKPLKIAALALGLSVFLASCGGPTSTAQAPQVQLTEADAWTGDLPADAEILTPEAFKTGLASGELRLVSSASLAAQQAARDQQFRDDKAFLAGLADKSPYVQALLAAAADLAGADRDIPAQIGGGQTVGLMSVATQLRGAVEAYQQLQDPVNALEAYTLSYDGLPDDLKAQADPPGGLQGASLAAIQAAALKLDTLLSNVPNLDGTRLDTDAGGDVSPGGVTPQSVNPGNGMDNSGVCAPSGYVKKYWFPLKRFISPVKDQRNRGTCWAFAAIGALESRERVQNNNAVNLSEQFLVNKVKQDWDSSDDEDGYRAEKALETAVKKGQVFPGEGAWTYNPASGRNYPKYANTCGGYTGTCSDTAHESRRACTTVVFKFCSYATVTYTGPGVGSSRTNLVWTSGKRFELNRYRSLLAQGYTLLTDFPVYKGFDAAGGAGGVVSDYTTATSDGKKAGGHAVQLVGFLSNDDLTTFSNTPKIGGGGYFILKNSWGCGAGDGGYYYVPADYVEKFFGSLRVLNFDGRRSGQWTQEQRTPGGTEAPSITLTAQGRSAQASSRVETNLAQFFTVSHPVAGSVTLTVTSNLDGTLYNGPWSLVSGPFGSFTELKATFATPGTRTIRLLARYGSSQSSLSFTLNVVNPPPTLTLNYTGTVYQGDLYSIGAVVTDSNEPATSNLCSLTTWAVDAPDILSASTGCNITVKFGSTGARQVRVSVRDSDGAVTARTLTLNVLPASANPYPKVKSAGVWLLGNIANNTCIGLALVNDGVTLDDFYRPTLCSDKTRTRYAGIVSIDNPNGEALTYDWKLYMGFPSGEQLYASSRQAVFDLTSGGGAGPATFPCRVTLTVGAPDPSRSKSLTVWTGKCTILFGTIIK